MNPRFFGTAVALVAALATVTCKDDPTASLSGSATRLLISPNPIFLTEGEAKTITVSAVNDNLRPVRATITASSPDPSVATVAADNGAPDPNGTSQKFTVTSLAPGQVLLAVSGAGLSSQDTVNVLPLSFNGTASTASPQVGQTLTLYATSVLKFDATSDIDFGAGVRGIVTNVHAESLTVIVPQPGGAQPAEIAVENVAVTFAPGALFTLPSADPFNVVNPYDPNDAPDPAAIVGEGVFYDGFKSGQADNFYRITIPAGGATVDFLLQWDGAADIDLLMCDAGCNNFIGSFGGATGNNPEDVSMVLPAGTHNLWINLYDAHGEIPPIYKVTINIQ